MKMNKNQRTAYDKRVGKVNVLCFQIAMQNTLPMAALQGQSDLTKPS
jgi:hypothetical protein